MKDTRALRALLQLLRTNGVERYTDGTLSVQFAATRPELPTQPRPVDDGPTDPERERAKALDDLRRGLFNADGMLG